MTDPFELLRERLIAAATTESPRERPRRRPGLRPLVLVAAALAATGTAAAAVVSFTTQESAPLAGDLPAEIGRGLEDATGYAVELSPNLSAGRSGWCWTLSLRRSGRPQAGGQGCSPAPPAGAPIIAAGSLAKSTGGSVRGVSWAVVDARVAGLRLADGRTISPRPSADLPAGWKAAVWFSSTEPSEPGLLAPTPLNAAGRELSTSANHGADTTKLPTRAVDPDMPPRDTCAIRVASGTRLRAVSERILTAPRARQLVLNARAFQSCASAIVYLGKRRFQAAVLVDARAPTRKTAALPGERPHPLVRGVVEANGNMTARRIRSAWLVVRGTDAQDRLEVLRGLRAWP